MDPMVTAHGMDPAAVMEMVEEEVEEAKTEEGDQMAQTITLHGTVRVVEDGVEEEVVAVEKEDKAVEEELGEWEV